VVFELLVLDRRSGELGTSLSVTMLLIFNIVLVVFRVGICMNSPASTSYAKTVWCDLSLNPLRMHVYPPISKRHPLKILLYTTSL
jgi:hypothetical protein